MGARQKEILLLGLQQSFPILEAFFVRVSSAIFLNLERLFESLQPIDKARILLWFLAKLTAHR